jgi:hypothetical protein
VRIAATVFAVIVTACQQQPTKFSVDPGWQITWDPYRNFVRYGFGDASGAYFWGMCDRFPFFGVSDGNYGIGVSTFKLIIDGKSWDLQAFQGEHGRGLIVADPAFADRFATAKSDITFITDDGWKRSFRPAPELGRFIQECRSLRQRDPDAMGREAHLQEAL